MLSKQQVDQFHRDGFLVVRGLYNAEEMQDISRWTDEVANSPEVPGHYMMYFEASKQDGARIILRIEDFVSFHEGFAQLITRKRMQQAVSDLIGEQAVLFKDNITFNGAAEGDHRAQYYADKRKSYPPDIERDPNKDYSFKV